jgi:putative endonuclease
LNTKWFVYLALCSDNTLYCGITTDISRREKEHNSKNKSAKYTRGRQPVKLYKIAEFNSKSEALKAELKIKKFNKKSKLELIKIKHKDFQCF